MLQAINRVYKNDIYGAIKKSLTGIFTKCILNYSQKKHACGRQRISWSMRIVGPIQFWRGCVIYQIFFVLFIQVALFFSTNKKNGKTPGKPRKTPENPWNTPEKPQATQGKPWENPGKPYENVGKTPGNPGKNPWENPRETPGLGEAEGVGGQWGLEKFAWGGDIYIYIYIQIYKLTSRLYERIGLKGWFFENLRENIKDPLLLTAKWQETSLLTDPV